MYGYASTLYSSLRKIHSDLSPIENANYPEHWTVTEAWSSWYDHFSQTGIYSNPLVGVQKVVTSFKIAKTIGWVEELRQWLPLTSDSNRRLNKVIPKRFGETHLFPRTSRFSYYHCENCSENSKKNLHVLWKFGLVVSSQIFDVRHNFLATRHIWTDLFSDAELSSRKICKNPSAAHCELLFFIL